MAFSAIPLFYYKEFYMNVQPKLEIYNLCFLGFSIVSSSDFSYHVVYKLYKQKHADYITQGWLFCFIDTCSLLENHSHGARSAGRTNDQK